MKTLGLSIFLAVLGFSYALATRSERAGGQPGSVAARGVSPRSVGQSLRFTNPFIGSNIDPAFPSGGDASSIDPQGFDLGDGVLGAPVTRYLTATGGFLPYTFETKANFEFIGSHDTPPVPHLVPNSNGKILDTFGTSTNGAARFNATVTDFVGTQRTGTFRLNLFAPPTKFRFAQDKLPTAQMGNAYFANFETLSPPGTVAFTIKGVVNGATRLDTQPILQLEDIGLSLAPDGILYGRPAFKIPAGNNGVPKLTFTVQAQQFPSGATAFGRSGQFKDQFFSLSVESNTQANSEILATQCTVRGDTSHENDSFTYNGVFDPKGMTADSLAGSPFTFRFNALVLAGFFDAKGKLELPLPGKKNAMKVSVNPTAGLISIKITGAPFPYLPPNGQPNNHATVSAVIGFEFKHYRTAEALRLAGRFAPNGKYELNYYIGHGGSATGPMGTNITADRSLAGGFQILSVHGSDMKKTDGTKGDPGVDGDQWQVRFIGVPRYGIDAGAATALPVRDNSKGSNQTGSVRATIRIGDDFEQDVTARINSDRLRFKADTHHDDGIYDLAIDGSHFVHFVQTNVLIEDDTGLSQAIKSKKSTIFKMGMDVTGFSGENGRIIAPNGFSWQSR